MAVVFASIIGVKLHEDITRDHVNNRTSE
jgi:hypothetical protein